MMKRKNLIIILILCLLSYPSIVMGDQEGTLDQQNATICGDASINTNHYVAQNFNSTYDTISKIELALKKIGTPPNPLQVSIVPKSGSDPDIGNKLGSVYFAPGDIGIAFTWYTVNFTPDISINPDNDYFILLNTTGGDNSNAYHVSYCNDDPNGSYYDGNTYYMFFTSNGGSSWIDFIKYDISFKTYGYNWTTSDTGGTTDTHGGGGLYHVTWSMQVWTKADQTQILFIFTGDRVRYRTGHETLIVRVVGPWWLIDHIPDRIQP